MGCDIHLFVETKRKDSKYEDWECSAFKGAFSEINYGMFGALNNVRNYCEYKPLPNRGLPENVGFNVFHRYYLLIVDKEEDVCEITCSKKDAEDWVNRGLSKIVELANTKYCSNPDYHSSSWCTVQEFESCVNQVFKTKDNTFAGAYIEWLALLNYMKTLEKEYDVRAVFWFDN